MGKKVGGELHTLLFLPSVVKGNYRSFFFLVINIFIFFLSVRMSDPLHICEVITGDLDLPLFFLFFLNIFFPFLYYFVLPFPFFFYLGPFNRMPTKNKILNLLSWGSYLINQSVSFCFLNKQDDLYH